MTAHKLTIDKAFPSDYEAMKTAALKYTKNTVVGIPERETLLNGAAGGWGTITTDPEPYLALVNGVKADGQKHAKVTYRRTESGNTADLTFENKYGKVIMYGRFQPYGDKGREVHTALIMLHSLDEEIFHPRRASESTELRMMRRIVVAVTPLLQHMVRRVPAKPIVLPTKKSSTPSKWTESEDATLLALVGTGASMNEVAIALGKSYDSVRKRYKRIQTTVAA